MTHPAVPCPRCGVPLVGARSFVSGRGLFLHAGDGLVVGYVLDAARTASFSSRRPRWARHPCPPEWDVVVTVLRGEATVCPVGKTTAKAVSKALGGRTSGPVERLPEVVRRLEAAGLKVLPLEHATPEVS